MCPPAPILCIGSILWDVIGRTPAALRLGQDVPGRIVQVPGGVATNVAMTLARMGLVPVLLSAVGRDVEGDGLIAAAAGMGIETGHVYRSVDLPTDRYMAIEGANGLIAAIADAHSLEAADDRILAPLADGGIADVHRPHRGVAALDGNLSAALLARIAAGPWLAEADLRVAPASPGKAQRLASLLRCPRATLYLNREEAGLLLGDRPPDAAAAARALTARGAARVLVTDGGRDAALAAGGDLHLARPPEVPVTRVTGAGDTFMAAHIAAELRGEDAGSALRSGLRSAAAHVSGDLG